jgi:hypothetical protein
MADELHWYTVSWTTQVQAPNPLTAMTGMPGVSQVTARIVDRRDAPAGQHCASCDGHACPGVG